MKIIIDYLIIVNFKGMRNLTITFDQILTNIFGDNATGKTTVFDAFTWLFFGKESTDRKDFNIKNTVDSSLNRQDHEVSAVINANGSKITIKRILREKWTKKRGSEIPEFTGNETIYYWDDVPVNQNEFNKKVSGLIDEKIFKLISNPAYFNELKWQDRRQILFDIAGEVTNEEIAGSNKKFREILAHLTNGKTLEDYKKQVASQRKKIKDDLEQIPTRIDEVNKNIPEMADASLIRRDIDTKQSKIKFIDDQMADRSNSMNAAYEKVREHQQMVYSKQNALDTIKNQVEQSIKNKDQDLVSERNQITREINYKEQELKQIEAQRERRQNEIQSVKFYIEDKRNQWKTINADRERVSAQQLVFDDHAFTCPTCSRLFDTDDIEAKKDEMLSTFNNDKEAQIASYAKNLALVVSQADSLKNDLKRLESLDTSEEIKTISDEIQVLRGNLSRFNEEFAGPGLSLEQLLETNEEYLRLLNELDSLKSSAPEEPKVDLTDLQNEKIELEQEIRQLERELAKEVVIKQSKERVSSLEADEKRLASELASYEGQEFTIEAFTRKKVEEVESRINGLFNHVKFKMFDVQINGGEVETCDTMYLGVPYSDLNNAARINAGLDIINTLCKYYGVNAPIFIDNAESVTKLIDVESQIIRLVVSEVDKKLRVA
ncbi:hypothetical protein FAZ19_16125 [Sphingobacterium alkalisoli]|uniref:Rad50/SbcC-type AAA domain-containing protein n=1 Tax=Sphingobacterium alkalisoli TaxID=1874115 RepID=A0A4U0GXE0_9SPHI|nr:AAA family ATPase [Sphingobacterium alkalisoli]TJY63793.1 hypothetical protein FAZ19_16125 [Sphingobacterium alkalisoli]GGH24852.1 hypothetical protein GCM10011418_33050 [Sphingobacterium alkalisoli]